LTGGDGFPLPRLSFRHSRRTKAAAILNFLFPLLTEGVLPHGFDSKLRTLLMVGPSYQCRRNGFRNVGGVASLLVLWRRHRAELLSACDPERRPWGYCYLERRLKPTPRQAVDEARAIRTLGLYYDARERAVVSQILRDRSGAPAHDGRAAPPRRLIPVQRAALRTQTRRPIKRTRAVAKKKAATPMVAVRMRTRRACMLASMPWRP
jgi:hypothetical protein